MINKQQLYKWVTATARESAWAPLSIFFLYLILVLIFKTYETFPNLDIPTHFLGGAAIAYFFRSAIANSQEFLGTIPRPVQILLGFTCAVTTAVLWEFYEYSFDHLFGTHMVRGLEDTLIDLLDGLLGALTLSIFYRRNPSPTLEGNAE